MLDRGMAWMGSRDQVPCPQGTSTRLSTRYSALKNSAASESLSPASASPQKASDTPQTAGSTPKPCPSKDACAESCRAHAQGSATLRLPSILRAPYWDRSDT